MGGAPFIVFVCRAGDNVPVMTSRRLLLPCLFVFAAMGCTKAPPTEEEVIKGIIGTISAAAETKDIRTMKKFISRGYRDKEGNDYDALNGFLLAHFFREEKIGVTLTGSQVTIGGDRATSHTEAILTGVPRSGGMAGNIVRNASYYRFDLEWRREEGNWKVTAASWGPMDKLP